MEYKDDSGLGIFKAIVFAILITISFVAMILTIVGLIRFSYNIIDHVSGEEISRGTMISNFIMFIIDFVIAIISLEGVKVIYKRS